MQWRAAVAGLSERRSAPHRGTSCMKFSRRRLFTALGAASVAGAGGLSARAALGRYYEGPVSDHFDGVRFIDPDSVPPKSVRDLARWLTEGGSSKWPTWVP